MNDLNEYQAEIKKRFGNEETYKNKVITPNDCVTLVAALGLAGEAGEVADHIKKEYFHEKELDEKDLLTELGDTLCYLAVVAYQYGFTLEDVANANINKIDNRYPSGFNFEDANKPRK